MCNAFQELGLQGNMKAIVFDKAANTGRINRLCTIMENLLQKICLHEIFLRNVFKVRIKKKSVPI